MVGVRGGWQPIAHNKPGDQEESGPAAVLSQSVSLSHLGSLSLFYICTFPVTGNPLDIPSLARSEFSSVIYFMKGLTKSSQMAVNWFHLYFSIGIRRSDSFRKLMKGA